MKTSLLSILAAASLMASTAMAAPTTASASATIQQNPYDRLNDRNDKDFNYGFDKKHRVTPDERKRWEEAHRNDRKEDKRDRKEDRKDDKRDEKNDRKYDKRDDRNDKDFNYGFDKKHRVTNEERARWEAAHRNDGRR
ncbi:hypothetical protein Q5H92_24235 [Hymenobacter sp. M29]|uniref:Uncharacterized protein n=1 Tax=Hymenobacter mellowenesis TaxID=3063995 RepID=A0ABT9AI28_9BACT|nr:hypothetical protein [Hymenobacter sp. M29]MDO7849496.1 hypothetical protein [Hymenobacter sp. M29]